MFRKKGTLAQLSLPWMEINRASALHLHYIILDYILSTSFCKHPTKQLPETIQQHAETSHKNIYKVFHKFICCTLKNEKHIPSSSLKKKKHGSLNVPIEHHPTKIGIWSTKWLLFQVMSNIPKMGQLPTPEKHLPKKKSKKSESQQYFIAAPGDCRAPKSTTLSEVLAAVPLWRGPSKEGPRPWRVWWAMGLLVD